MNFKKLIATPIALGLTVGSFPVVNSPAYANSAEVSVPKGVVRKAFNSALSSTRVRLDNYGKKGGTTGHKNSSYILYPNGNKKSVSIPDYRFNVNSRRQLRYYVDAMNTSSVRTNANGKGFKTILNFESQGEEIKTKCIRKRFRKWKPCLLKMEKDAHLNNSKLSMSFIPVAYKGSISYKNPVVNFQTNIITNKNLCTKIKGFCKHIRGRVKNEFTRKVETSFKSGLNNPQVKAKVAKSVKNSLRNHLGKRNNWRIVSIRSQGNNFILKLSK
ncbi:MAG: hypothetical protein AAFR37_10185 [Cyanobacteria bacterium J06628_3]